MSKIKNTSFLLLLFLLSSCSTTNSSSSILNSSTSISTSISISNSSNSNSQDNTKVVTLKKRVDDKFIDITTESVTSGNKLTYSTTPTVDKKTVTDSDELTSTSVYTFKQWVTLPSGKTEADWNSLSESDFITFDITNTVITDNITVYATFDVANTYQVAFYNADGTTLLQEATTINEGDKVTYNNSNPTKDTDSIGTYTFAGWKTSDGTIVDISTTTISKNYKLIANFDCDAYPVVTIVDQNDNVIYKRSVPTGTTISGTVLSNELFDNYWNDEENKQCRYFVLTDAPINDIQIRKNRTCHATVTTISYEKNGIWPQTKVTDTTLQANIDNALSSSPYTLGSNTYAVVDNKYYSKEGTTYRKVEPIKWIILDGDFETGATLISEKVLTSKVYFDYTRLPSPQSYHYASRNIDGKTIWHSNYKYSDVREWLNGDFITNTFEDDSLLQTTEVDNSKDTYKTTDTVPEETTVTQVMCDNTSDKVWLLSLEEVFSEASNTDFTPYKYFGNFSQLDNRTLAKRVAYDVDGVASKWFLRTPYNHETYVYYIRMVDTDGTSTALDCSNESGVRPVIKFKI